MNGPAWLRAGQRLDEGRRGRGRILDGAATLDTVGDEIFAAVLATAAGARTKSEALGHQEFVLTYKTHEAAGPAWQPIVA